MCWSTAAKNTWHFWWFWCRDFHGVQLVCGSKVGADLTSTVLPVICFILYSVGAEKLKVLFGAYACLHNTTEVTCGRASETFISQQCRSRETESPFWCIYACLHNTTEPIILWEGQWNIYKSADTETRWLHLLQEVLNYKRMPSRRLRTNLYAMNKYWVHRYICTVNQQILACYYIWRIWQIVCFR